MSLVNREFKILNWRQVEKGKLRGFFSVELPSGMIINDCSLFMKDDGVQFVGFPSRQFTNKDGQLAYSNYVEFVTKDAKERFQVAALAALERYYAE